MNKLFLLLICVAGTSVPCWAQWAVIDVAGLTQSITNYAALTEQIAKQATQISNQIQQIKQMDDQLKRAGDMSSFKSLVGFTQFKADLGLPSQVKTWESKLALVDGSALFGDTRGGVYKGITSEFPDFDGSAIKRDPVNYKQGHDVLLTVDEFKTVESDVLKRREDLKKAIASTSEAMQAADTEAEQQKLAAVLKAQYGELAAIDSEATLSAAQVQVKTAEVTAMKDAQGEADAEARRQLSKQEVKKISSVFTPTYECMLSYVTEKPLGD